MKKGDKRFAHKGHKPGDKGRKDGKKEMNAKLFAGIDLTAEQQAQLKSLKAQVRENVQKERADVEKRVNEIRKKEREEYNKGVKAILNAEQWTKFEANKADMKAKREAKKQMKAANKN